MDNGAQLVDFIACLDQHIYAMQHIAYKCKLRILVGYVSSSDIAFIRDRLKEFEAKLNEIEESLTKEETQNEKL